MRVTRRNLLKLSAVTAGAAIVGAGGGYALFHNPDPLADFYASAQEVLGVRVGRERASELIQSIRDEYEALSPQVPYIGGDQNAFTEWLTYGAYYLAVYRVLQVQGHSLEQVGCIIYDTYETMADYPVWMLRLVGGLKYGEGYVKQLREAAALSQERRYPGDWVCTFVEGDGETFDHGLDVSECGICKFYDAQGAGELAPYMCLSDYVVSCAFDRGLVRYRTVAEGADVCDFRFRKGRETFVYPLRNGWPPGFMGAGQESSRSWRPDPVGCGS